MTDAVKMAIERIKARFHPHYGIDGASDSKQLASDCQTLIAALEQAGEPVADFYYPIEMPLNADGHGPATVGEDATTMTFEVWDQFCDSHGRFARLSDAIQRARQLNALPTLQRLGQEFDAGEGHRLAHAWLDENFSDVPDADFSAADMERAFLAGLAQSRGQAVDGDGEARTYHADDCEAMQRPRADCTCAPMIVTPAADAEMRKLLDLIETADEHGDECAIVEQAAAVRQAIDAPVKQSLTTEKGSENGQ